MISRLAAIAASLLVLPTTIQAQSTVPQPVIEQCNSTARASELPNCLKNGAIGFEMLELLRTEEFYGAIATPVIDYCATRNETFASTWLCFRRAAADASETGSLIGRDNIADRCIAGLSDPALDTQINDIYRSKREERFPDEMYFGGETFYPFQGCPDTSPDTDERGSDASSVETPRGPADTGLDTDACSALAEVENLVARSSANELRAFGADLRSMEEPGPDQIAEAFDFSSETAQYLLAGDENHGVTIATTVGAFINEHHPDLLLEFFEQHETPTSNIAEQMGNEMAQGFMTMIIDAAHERYLSSCEE